MIEVNLGEYKPAVDAALQRLTEQRVIRRIWSHDHTVWKPEPAEISNRLGWLRSAEISKQSVARLTGLADELRSRKPRSLRVCCLLDKKSRRQVEFDVDYVGFDIEDRFVVGYGLDVNEQFRNLPSVHYVVE